MLFEADREHIAAIVRGIERGNSDDIQRLHSFLERGLTLIVKSRYSSVEVEDIVADTLLDVVVAIRGKRIQRPESIAAFAVTIVRRRVAQKISERVRERQTLPISDADSLPSAEPSTENSALLAERRQIMHVALQSLDQRGREILRRFYLLGQSAEIIQAELGLTEIQFRLFKSRAKARLVAACRSRLEDKQGAIARIIKKHQSKLAEDRVSARIRHLGHRLGPTES